MVKVASEGFLWLVHWLRLWASNSGGMDSIPDQGIKIPHAMGHGQKKKKKTAFETDEEMGYFIYDVGTTG